jgi:hypothetical protein
MASNNTLTHTPEERMLPFLTKFAAVVRGVVSGFDRLFFGGSLRNVAHVSGLKQYLWKRGILYVDFAAHSQKLTAHLEETSLQQAQRLGREIRYLNSARDRKEDIARAIAARDRIRSGLICVLRSVDPCMSFEVTKNRQTRKLEIHYRQRKCLHLYHYQIHPVFGFMHTRIQTWFPFRIYVCINGREWLARQMDQAKLHYVRRDNTFTWLQDVNHAQALLDQQVQADWPSLLGELAATVKPMHAELLSPYHYYWSVRESAWASDVMFQSRAALTALYPRFVQHAVTSFEVVDVLRFLGQPVPASGKVPHACRHEINSNLKERVEGVRMKHWLNGNSLKMYDKTSVLRVESLIRAPGDFKVYRAAEGDPQGAKDWRPLRQGVIDMPQRAAVSQAANERYLEALAAMEDRTPLRQLAEPLCAPAVEPMQQAVPPDPTPTATATAAPPSAAAGSLPQAGSVGRGQPRRVRALNPLAPADAALLEAVSRHEFLINGLRNRDLRAALYEGTPATEQERRRQSAAVTRRLRLLRAHDLIGKVPKTHRYLVSESGRRIITALLAARNAGVEALTRCAG